MLRALLGLVKGLVVGGGVAYLLLQMGVAQNGAVAYAACALVGAFTGVIAGKAPWRAETIWTPVLKAIVGGGFGALVCFLGRRFLPDPHFALAGVGDIGLREGPFLSLAVGVLWGIFVEVDDGATDADKKPDAAPKAAQK